MPQHNFSRRLTTIFSVEIAHFRTDITASLALLDQELADGGFTATTSYHCREEGKRWISKDCEVKWRPRESNGRMPRNFQNETLAGRGRTLV